MVDLGFGAADIGLPGAGSRVVEQVRALAQEIRDQRLPIFPNCAARTVIADVEPIVRVSQEVGIPIEAATFIGSSPIRQYAEDWTLDRILASTEEAVTYAVKHGLPVMYVTEDTTRAKPEALKALYGAAIDCGAMRICLADTVGHATPDGVKALVRTYECGRLDGDADLLGDSDDRLHVGYHRAGRAVGEDGQPLVPDLLGERPHLLDDPRPGPRQPEVGRHDAEVGHEVQQLPLDLERGVPDRGGLESVAQGLVVQVDLDPRPVEPGAGPVPVVNQFTLVHDPSVALSPGTVKPVSVNGWIRPSRACSRMSASAPRAITSSAPTR